MAGTWTISLKKIPAKDCMFIQFFAGGLELG